MKLITNILFFILMEIPAFSQNWINAGIPIETTQIRTVAIDTISNKLYAGGYTHIDTYGNSSLCIYDGADWIVKDTINNLIRALTFYNNELYMGGDFVTINSQPMKYLAKWNGTNWINIGTSGGGILNLRVINNELYAVGTFTQIAGVNANSIAKWNGISWISLNFPDSKHIGNYSAVGDCALYKSSLYVSGNFQTNSGLTDIAMLHNGTWQRVGNNDSIRGTFSNLFKMAVFNNELYVSGYLAHSEGNVGNGIQKWDGLSWKTVGTGLQDYNNTTNSVASVQDMLVHKGKLYVAGGFSFAGNSKAPNLAVWDGIKWCAVDTLIESNKNITAFGIYRDTVFIGTHPTLENVNVNSFAKFIKGDYNYTEKCSSNFDVGVSEINNNQIKIYPNPTNSILNIADENNQFQYTLIEIKNTLGQVVLSIPFSNHIDISFLASGMYFLTVQDKYDKQTVKIIKE
ncbi:MAG: T9SS type A sorting domain-containing protein [Bacteroidia bacterium]|nr:T9SS type A sorting domain-containing protein [Bacteroidia bacterium]